MIGSELSNRVSPSSVLRTSTLVPDEAQNCWVCGCAFTACMHSDFAAPETTTAEQVKQLVAERAKAQTRRPGRPPVKGKKPDFSEKVEAPTPEPEVAPMVAPTGPVDGVEVAPGDPEAPVAAPAAQAAPVPSPEPVAAPAPIGADYGSRVQTLSPVAPEVRAEVPRVAADTIPAGDPQEVRSTYDVPPGRMDPIDDPSCPAAVLINDHSQIGATGAWMTLPGGATAALTHDVMLVSWQDGTRNPLYRLVGSAGSVISRPVV